MWNQENTGKWLVGHWLMIRDGWDISGQPTMDDMVGVGASQGSEALKKKTGLPLHLTVSTFRPVSLDPEVPMGDLPAVFASSWSRQGMVTFSLPWLHARELCRAITGAAPSEPKDLDDHAIAVLCNFGQSVCEAFNPWPDGSPVILGIESWAGFLGSLDAHLSEALSLDIHIAGMGRNSASGTILLVTQKSMQEAA